MINEIKILNQNNEKLFVEIYEPLEIKSTVIYCHGITGCRKGRKKEDNYIPQIAKKLMDLNYKVVLFDFSGHGDSEGNDYDVCLSKNTKELEIIFNKEVEDKNNVNFIAFSYGSAVLCNFLSNNPKINPKHIVLYSPGLYPNISCFLNCDSLFGKVIVENYNNGQMKEKGYCTIGNNFHLGINMIEECAKFKPDYISKFSSKILVLTGTKDNVLNIKYNNDFCIQNKISNIYLDAGHSLFDDIETVFNYTINFLEKNIVEKEEYTKKLKLN